MKCRILHETSRRMRVHILRSRMTLEQADLLEYYLLDKPFITEVKVNDRTGNAIIFYTPGMDARQMVIEALQVFSYEDEQAAALVPEHTGRALNRRYETRLVLTVLGHGFRTLIADLTKDPDCFLLRKVCLERFDAIQINKHCFVTIAKRNDAQASWHQYLVQAAEISLHFLPALIRIRKHIPGLESRQCGRSAFDQKLIRHLLLPFISCTLFVLRLMQSAMFISLRISQGSRGART